jgi:fumarate reductase subunit C
MSEKWFHEKYNLVFTIDIGAIIVIFFLIFLFYKLSHLKGMKQAQHRETGELAKFIEIKKVVSILLVPLFAVLALYSIPYWFYTNFSFGQGLISDISGVNKIFFNDFFTVLILTDVFLLLISFINTDNYRRVIRNSGFVISTILIKMSFSADGLLNIALIVAAIAFGVIILGIHNLFNQITMPNDKL